METHFNKRSFSDTSAIAEHLESVGVPATEVKECYPSLSELMARRHEIVHIGDLKTTVDEEGERDAEPIGAAKVKEWYETVLPS